MKWHVKGSYLQYFECFIEADTWEQAYDEAISGDAEYMMCDCDDWYIDSCTPKDAPWMKGQN